MDTLAPKILHFSLVSIWAFLKCKKNASRRLTKIDFRLTVRHLSGRFTTESCILIGSNSPFRFVENLWSYSVLKSTVFKLFIDNLYNHESSKMSHRSLTSKLEILLRKVSYLKILASDWLTNEIHEIQKPLKYARSGSSFNSVDSLFWHLYKMDLC